MRVALRPPDHFVGGNMESLKRYGIDGTTFKKSAVLGAGALAWAALLWFMANG